MLGGLAPLIVITLKNKGVMDFFGEGASAGLLDTIAESVGLPIPIYLDEKITGIFIDTESKAIDVTTKVDAVTGKGLDGQVAAPEVSQQSRDSQLSINMHAKRGSIMLQVFLALCDLIVDRLVSAEYSIHYINGPTCIFGAKLARFAHNSASGTDRIDIEMSLSTAAKEKNPTPTKSVESLKAVSTTNLSVPPG